MTPERALRWLARLARVVCWPFVRFDVAGGEELNRVLPSYILVVDHRSLFDVVAGLIVFHRYHRQPRVLIERSFVESRWTRPFAHAIGAIPVDRRNHRGLAFAAAVDALHAGHMIVILPEGRVHVDPDDPLSTRRAATGASRLAEASGVPVVAAGMVGTEQVWALGAKLPRLRPWRRPVVAVRVADAPVALDGIEGHRARTEVIMADVRRLMGEAVAEVPAALDGWGMTVSR